MAENHDRDQGGELPPYVDLEEAEGSGQRSPECDDDRQADERHHARLASGELAARCADENEATIEEDERSEDGGNELRARERWRDVAQPVLDVGRPEYDRNCEREAQPEFIPKHRDGMSGVTIVAPLSACHRVTGVRVGPAGRAREVADGLPAHG